MCVDCRDLDEMVEGLNIRKADYSRPVRIMVRYRFA